MHVSAPEASVMHVLVLPHSPAIASPTNSMVAPIKNKDVIDLLSVLRMFYPFPG
jgi:hypothetical protein